MLYNPFVHAYLVRERMHRYEQRAAAARLLSAPRSRRPGPGVDTTRPPGPAVPAATGADPPQ